MIRLHCSERLLQLGAFLLVLASACARSSSVPEGASAPASVPAAAAPSARGVIGGYGLAAPETMSLSPSLDSEQANRQPTVDYPSFNIARESIEAIVRRAVGPRIQVKGGPARFAYRFLADSVDGWAFHIAVTDTSECPDFRVERELEAAGWAHAEGYSADGADGSVMGFVTKQFLCVVEGRWDGGDDTDSTYVPPPGCEVTVTCVPRRPDDVPKW